MDVDRTCVRGDEHLENYFCGHCNRIAVDPRAHSGGYDQIFCQRIFCQSCIVALQNTEINLNFTIDCYGKKHPRCPDRTCYKEFNPPYFRFMCPAEISQYKKIIIECIGCHAEFDPYEYSYHCTVCMDLRRLRPWTPNVIINAPPPRNEVQVVQRKLALEQYESKWRMLSMRNHPNNHGSPMTGTEEIVKVYMATGMTWSYRDVTLCADKQLFLNRVNEAFGVNVDGEVSGLTHRNLSSFLDTRSFVNGFPSGTPLMFHERRASLSCASNFGSWLFLKPVPAENFRPATPVIISEPLPQ